MSSQIERPVVEPTRKDYIVGNEAFAQTAAGNVKMRQLTLQYFDEWTMTKRRRRREIKAHIISEIRRQSRFLRRFDQEDQKRCFTETDAHWYELNDSEAMKIVMKAFGKVRTRPPAQEPVVRENLSDFQPAANGVLNNAEPTSSDEVTHGPCRLPSLTEQDAGDGAFLQQGTQGQSPGSASGMIVEDMRPSNENGTSEETTSQKTRGSSVFDDYLSLPRGGSACNGSEKNRERCKCVGCDDRSTVPFLSDDGSNSHPFDASARSLVPQGKAQYPPLLPGSCQSSYGQRYSVGTSFMEVSSEGGSQECSVMTFDHKKASSKSSQDDDGMLSSVASDVGCVTTSVAEVVDGWSGSSFDLRSDSSFIKVASTPITRGSTNAGHSEDKRSSSVAPPSKLNSNTTKFGRIESSKMGTQSVAHKTAVTAHRSGTSQSKGSAGASVIFGFESANLSSLSSNRDGTALPAVRIRGGAMALDYSSISDASSESHLFPCCNDPVPPVPTQIFM